MLYLVNSLTVVTLPPSSSDSGAKSEGAKPNDKETHVQHKPGTLERLTKPDEGNDGFRLSAYEVRRKSQRDRKTVYGRSSHDSLKGASRRSELFVFCLSHETTDDMVKEYIESKNIMVHGIECISHQNARNKPDRS